MCRHGSRRRTKGNFVKRCYLARACIVTLLCWFCQLADAQSINGSYLRHDETLSYDEIVLRFSASCVPASDSRTLALGVDEIRFLDTNSSTVARIDIGTQAGSYWLGEGWHGDERWTSGVTMRWASGLAPQTAVYYAIPRGAAFLEIVGTTACASITTAVFLNGQRVGEFSLPAYSAFTA